MIVGMTTAKIAVSLPKEVLRRAQRAVRRGRAPSMSAYVAEALEQKSKGDDLEDLLDEMLEETGGPMTAKEKRLVDRLLRPKRATSRRSR